MVQLSFGLLSGCWATGNRPGSGFSELLPVGRGLLSFATPGEAVAAVREVEANYTLHQSAALELAQMVFDSDVVLQDLVTHVL